MHEFGCWKQGLEAECSLPSQALPTWLFWFSFLMLFKPFSVLNYTYGKNIYTWGFPHLGVFFRAGHISGNTSSSTEKEKIAFQMKSPQDVVPERGLTTFAHFIKCFSARYKSLFLVAVRLLPQPYGTQTLGSGANLLCPVPALLLVQPWGCGDTGYHCREGWRREPGRGQALPVLLRYLHFQVAVPSMQPRGLWLSS